MITELGTGASSLTAVRVLLDATLAQESASQALLDAKAEEIRLAQRTEVAAQVHRL